MIFASDWLWLIEHFGQQDIANWIPWSAHLFLSVRIVIIRGSDIDAPSFFRPLAVSTFPLASSTIVAQSSLIPTDHCCTDRESHHRPPCGRRLISNHRRRSPSLPIGATLPCICKSQDLTDITHEAFLRIGYSAVSPCVWKARQFPDKPWLIVSKGNWFVVAPIVSPGTVTVVIGG